MLVGRLTIEQEDTVRRIAPITVAAGLLAFILIFAACGSSKKSSSSSPSGGASDSVGGGGAVAVQTGQGTGIQVTGVGEVVTTPDVALVQLGVDVSAEKLADAQSDAVTRMSAVMQALKAKGVADTDITTIRYNIYRETPPVPVAATPGTTIPAYVFHVTNIVQAKLRDVSKVGDVIDAAIAAGANEFDSISFTVDDPSRLQEDARKKAMDDAKAKADALAGYAGVKVGKPVLISDASVSPVSIAAAAQGLGGGGTPISGGETTIQVTLQVVYTIE